MIQLCTKGGIARRSRAAKSSHICSIFFRCWATKKESVNRDDIDKDNPKKKWLEAWAETVVETSAFLLLTTKPAA
jgi:hypothetical protein